MVIFDVKKIKRLHYSDYCLGVALSLEKNRQ